MNWDHLGFVKVKMNPNAYLYSSAYVLLENHTAGVKVDAYATIFALGTGFSRAKHCTRPNTDITVT